MAITQSKQTYNGANHRIQGRRLDTVGGAWTLSLNFTVRYFQLVNLTDQITHEWYEGMAAGTTLKTIATGVRTLDVGNDVAISPDAGSGDQDGSGGTPDTTNAGVDNNVAYPGPATVINSTATAIPGIEPSGQVLISAAAGLANKQYTWVAQG